MDNGDLQRANRKHRKRADLCDFHSPRDDLARQEREKSAKCKQTSRPHVDWSFLLKLNPPPGYTADNDKTDKGLSKIPERCDDKVVKILQKILRDLEKEIREEKRELRVSSGAIKL